MYRMRSIECEEYLWEGSCGLYIHGWMCNPFERWLICVAELGEHLVADVYLGGGIDDAAA